mmetsp:Transcript_17813/g.27566  ORF Transcript_17813/g.27566 Transcript_17813/m.27566 type:complete len:125 (-) Transcript_17813:1047-1421(-)
MEMAPIDGVKFIQGDITEDKIQDSIGKALDFFKADLVCSDAVPEFIGERFVDHIRAIHLNNVVIKFCDSTLRPGGDLLMKIIKGPAEKELMEGLDMRFKHLQQVKPAASRSQSSETYMLCRGFD